MVRLMLPVSIRIFISERIGMRRIVIFAVAVLGVANAEADSVQDMCLDWQKSHEICECGARQLKLQVGDDDYALYEAVAAVYIVNKAQGIDMGGAWDDAVNKESANRGTSFISTLQQTNTMGKAHNKAIKGCAG